MIWIIDKFVVKHEIELPALRITVPIRIKIEYRKEGGKATDLRKEYIFNKEYLLKKVPWMREEDLVSEIEKAVSEAIEEYLSNKGLSLV